MKMYILINVIVTVQLNWLENLVSGCVTWVIISYKSIKQDFGEFNEFDMKWSWV